MVDFVEKARNFFRNRKKWRGAPVESNLKRLSINRQDLVREIGAIDIDSPINAYLTLAILLKEKGEYYKSLRILRELLNRELTPEEERLVILNLALVYRSAGFIDRAEEALQRGIERFPDESFFYYELARIRRMSGRLEEAVKLLERAAELKEEFCEELLHTKLYLANHYIEEGRTDRAFRIMRKLNPRFPTPLFYYVLSKLYYYVGESEKGFRAALSGIKMSPAHIYPFLEVMERNGELTLERLEKIEKVCSLPSLALVSKKVELLLAGGKRKEALEVLERYCSQGGFFSAALFETYLKIMWEEGQRKQVVSKVVKSLRGLKRGRNSLGVSPAAIRPTLTTGYVLAVRAGKLWSLSGERRKAPLQSF